VDIVVIQMLSFDAYDDLTLPPYPWYNGSPNAERDNMRTEIQPLFKWTGSKQRMLDAYHNRFYPSSDFPRFVDLFAGGLTNTIQVHEMYPNVELVINDFNSELIQMYNDLASYEHEVVATWELCVATWLDLPVAERKAYYYRLRDTYTLDYPHTKHTILSGLLLFMLMVNFNGMWKTYIKCNHRYSTPPGTCTQGESFFEKKRINIPKVASMLRSATILNKDFRDVPLLDGDFVYADPPYRDSVVDYQGGFTEADQIDLSRMLEAHNGPYAYSNKDIGDGYYDMYMPLGTKHIVPATYTAGRGTSTIQVTEVLISRPS